MTSLKKGRGTCSAAKKVRFRDELSAKMALARSFRSRSSGREEVRVYRCSYCRGWHLTSKG